MNTLKSIGSLLTQINNMVIEDNVAGEIKKSVECIQDTLKYLENGHLLSAFYSSRTAFRSSEVAFFDPSLLEMLYFPEDQRYYYQIKLIMKFEFLLNFCLNFNRFAIYIPLFIPIGLPVLLSIKYVLKWFKRDKKEGEMKEKVE
jgi:GPI-anchor transamidase subunit S